jgi:phosphate starvation-inducible protein PhoH and related proteins
MSGKNRVAQQKKRDGKREDRGRVVKSARVEKELKTPVQAKNEVQRMFLKALKDKSCIVFEAPAGVGKSFLAMSEVSDWIKKGLYEKCYLTRPAVGMGNSVGLLKGGLRDKYEPYLLPLVDVVVNRYGKGFYESSLHNQTIEFALLEYIRGRSIDQIVVLDEAQNVRPDEMYTMLTRIADGGKLICIGDRTQSDIRGQNGIEWLVDFVERHPELEDFVEVIRADSDDIVRGGLCKTVVKAKEKDNRNQEGK